MTAALVLALNPSIDAEWRVEDVLWEEKNNVHSERRWAGGKGINVARWLKQLGGKPQLLLPLGGQTGAELGGYLRAEKLPATIVRLAEPTRVNVILTTNGGRQMRFNPLGPILSHREWRGIVDGVKQGLARISAEQGGQRQFGVLGRNSYPHRGSAAQRLSGLLILSGSLPRGAPVSAYAHFIRLAHVDGIRTLLDCDGPVLAAAVKARPFLVKPNEHELAQWWGKPLRGKGDILRAAGALSGQTLGWVLVSRGAQPSLLLNVAEGFAQFASPRRVKPRNTVGAGDALLAGVARQIQLGHQPAKWLQHGLTVGTRATEMPPGQMP